ncbi:chromatin-modulating protein mrc1 [Desmophyllum pertusum]|uniref:Chromatin-modulating protein mrc1 n=1 Tax=Desmophyllum pertusum TaxID=174260 RepID=A0A9W9ZNQ6_9CNID|nr:chromatin-modulating protein mrc1 [Desmophyllum pertusum]
MSCSSSPLYPPRPMTLTTTAIIPTKSIQELSCSSGWTKYGTSCYKPFNNKMSWSDANDHCQRHGGSLIAINDAKEQNFVNRMTRQLFWRLRVWIGLRRGPEGKFCVGTTVKHLTIPSGSGTSLTTYSVRKTAPNVPILGSMAGHFM